MAGNKVKVELPQGTTHYYLNLIDENQFLRSYPEVTGRGKSFIGTAVSLQEERAAPMKKSKPKKGKLDRNIPFDR